MYTCDQNNAVRLLDKLISYFHTFYTMHYYRCPNNMARKSNKIHFVYIIRKASSTIKQIIDSRNKTKLTTDRETYMYLYRKTSANLMKNIWLAQLYTSYCANDNRSRRTYIGLNENIFKTKCKNHKTSFYSYMRIEMAPNLANMFGNRMLTTISGGNIRKKQAK